MALMRSMFRNSGARSAFEDFSLMASRNPPPTFRLNSFFRDDDWMTHGFNAGSSKMEIFEHENNYDINIEAPGLQASDIKVQLTDGILSVEGKSSSNETKEDAHGKVVYSERKTQSFFRQVALPENINTEGITATQKDGVMSLNIPKKEPSKPHTVHISVLPGDESPTRASDKVNNGPHTITTKDANSE